MESKEIRFRGSQEDSFVSDLETVDNASNDLSQKEIV